jgi:hypothetical protein
MANSLTGRNNTQACPDDSECMLSCTSPDLPSNQCITYNQYFVDGTSCGAGGHCSNGSCQGSSTIKEIGKWIDSHKAIFIPIVSVVGLLILIALISCISSSIRRRSRSKRVSNQPPPQMAGWQSSTPYGGLPQQRQQQQQQQWNGQQTSWNQQPHTESSGALFPEQHQHQQGGYYDPPPYPPPPAATADGRWENNRPMRYM